jgi:pimeloyl-ACP methyl ester carboxylesterase
MVDGNQDIVEMPGKGFSESLIDADGFSIRYREAGDGDPLVWLHGGGGLRISPVYDMLAETRRVIAFEIPGFGDSAANDRSQNMQELADTMLAATTALGIDAFDLVGSSFGGKLAAWMAVRSPQRINTLVLCSPAAIRLEKPAGAGDRGLGPGFLYAHPERQPPMEDRLEEIITKERALISRVRGPARDAELEAGLAELDVPTLVLLGTEDQISRAELGDIYREMMPICQVVMIYDAAHAIDADRPEAVAAVMEDYLARQERFLVKEQSGLLYP